MKQLVFNLIMSLLLSEGFEQTIDFMPTDLQPNLMEVYAGSFARGDNDEVHNSLFQQTLFIPPSANL